MRARSLAASMLMAATLAVGLSACAGSAGTKPMPEVRITTEERPSEVCMEALISGVLVLHPQWGLGLQVPGTGEVDRPMFPFGYRGALDGDRVALLDEDGKVIARTGDLIQASGGFVGGEGNPLVILCDDTIVVVVAAD